MLKENTNSRIISVIDDDIDIVTLFYDALSSLSGIMIYKFTDPIIALEHIKMNKESYILILSDFRMPGLNGLELAKKTKDINKNIRTILMTAFDIDDKLFDKHVKEGIINGFLQKPVEIKALFSEISKQISLNKES